MTRLVASLRVAWVPATLVVLAVAVVALVAGLVPGSTGGPGQGAPLPQETPTGAPTPQATETADLADIGTRVTSYEVFLARDPFEPVIPEPVEGGDGTGEGGTPTTSPTASPTTSPTASPTTSPTASPSPTDGSTAPGDPDGGCVADGAVRCGEQTVSLVDVYDRDGASGAVVRVDDTLYDVGEGEVFATNFRVLSIESPCVTLQYGDDRFSLCEGESVLK